MPNFSRVASLAFLAACASIAFSQENPNDYVPIETRNYRDLSLPFLRLDPRPWVLDKGEQSLTLGFSAANDLRQMYVNGVQKIYEAYENDVFTARYRKGLGHGMDFTVDVPFISRGGGFMDPIIYAWHQIWGLTQNLRQTTPFGQCIIDVPGSGPYHTALGFGDISAELTKELTPRLMGTVGVKAPTGNAGQILGSGAVDGAVDLQYKFPLGRRWMMQIQGGMVAQGASTELKSTRSLNPQAALVWMHRANRYDGYILQWQTEESGTITGVGGSDSPHRQLTVAFQRHFTPKRMLEAYFTEDGNWENYRWPEVANIGPITLGFRYTMKW